MNERKSDLQIYNVYFFNLIEKFAEKKSKIFSCKQR